MGVPAFFRWLSRKYPSIVISCVEEKSKKLGGYNIPVDATQPNPNDVEFDNLYLDMNGIIHPCCHPEDKPAPKDEDEMMVAIFEYIDRIFNIVRPRRLLYMAIDGVAPRAKMNQQRSRRFRAAKESIEKIDEVSEIREKLERRGCVLPPMKPKESHFDSNCITPGTEFMARLAKCLRYYIHDRMNNNPAWQGVMVILSDANVPGEGEHKIMDYIRHQRSQPDHDPNTHHCLYGADADLIMLGLATHEPHFTIIREEFKPGQSKSCEICGQEGHSMKECTGEAKEKEGEFDEMANTGVVQEKEFIFIRIPILREYLERELRIDGLPFPFDLERAIDDWVFMCFFVGNDFLPHLPSLEIREGAIDRLIRLYKQVVPQTHGYLTHNGKVNLNRVQLILTELGKVEDDIFKRRRQKDVQWRERNRANRKRQKYNNDAPKWTPDGQFAPTPIGATPSPLQNVRHDAYQMRQMSSLSANKQAASSLKEQLKSQSVPDGSGQSNPSSQAPSNDEGPQLGQKRKWNDGGNDSEDSEPEDDVRLWEDGWKERYYNNKFGVPCDDDEFVRSVAEQYTRGLCWVFAYYYQGCPSWKWFYSYHYAPFASDFKNVTQVRGDFDKGTLPFKPLEQLMGVFPAASGKFLPPSWKELMSAEDSPVIDFYPTNFRIDLNGKKYAWQGVALLPFVDEKRLLEALLEVYPNLIPSEEDRNSLGCDKIFMYRHHRSYPFIKALYDSTSQDELTEDTAAAGAAVGGETELNPAYTNGVRGIVATEECMTEVLKAECYLESPLASLPDIKKSYVISSKFINPQYPEGHIFEAKLLPGAELPPKMLKPGDFMGPRSYQPKFRFGNSTPPPRQYNTPESAQRMIRHSLSDPRGNSFRPSYPPPSQPAYGSASYNPQHRSSNYDNQYASSHGSYYNSGGQYPSSLHGDSYHSHYGGGGHGADSYGGHGYGRSWSQGAGQYGDQSGSYGYRPESSSRYYSQSKGEGYGERYSSQGASHGFRGSAPSGSYSQEYAPSRSYSDSSSYSRWEPSSSSRPYPGSSQTHPTSNPNRPSAPSDQYYLPPDNTQRDQQRYNSYDYGSGRR